MISPSQSYHLACGSPAVDGAVDLPPGALCATCGCPARRGLLMRKWPGADSLILDKLRVPASLYACDGCVFSCTWIAPPGRVAKEGQGRGPSPTMYSHLLELTPDGPRYANASKGEKPIIRSWLTTPREHPWWIVVADMGKKQLIPWAEWNHGPATGATIHLDDEPVVVGDLALVDAMAHLLTVGATKATLETGQYTPGEWGRCADALLAFERTWGHLRGAAWFRLALWLGQRDEAAVEERMAAEKAEREAKKAAEKEAAKKAKAKPSAKPAPPPPPKAKPAPKARKAAAESLAETPAPPVAECGHEDRRDEKRTPADAHGGVPVGPVPAGDPQRVVSTGPLGPDEHPAARRRPDQRRPRRVDERDAPQPEAARPGQGQLGLFD